MRKRIHTLLVILVVFATLLCGCKKTRTTEELDILTMGIDVARYQGIIDWQQVADAGVDFAMVRVGYRTKVDGEMKEDSCARYNLQEAAKQEIPLGVYYFSTAINEEEAVAEAEWVVDLIEGYPITYPVVYDCEGYEEEDSRQYSLTKQERTDIALAFLKTIEKHGYEGMFYSSRNEMHNEAKWEVSRIAEKYKIWVAQYPDLPYPQTTESTYFDEHHMWQYSTAGDIPGISQNVDLNVAYFGYDGIEKPHSSKRPEEVEADVEALLNFQEVDETITAKEETNLRSIPSQGEDSQVLYTLRNGQIARRIAVCDSGWSKLEFEGNIYYAKTSLLTRDLDYVPGQNEVRDDDGIETEFSPVSYHVTAKDAVNLRALPSVEREDAVVLTQLKKGQIASCVGISTNGWSKLDYNGTICYAVTSYLEEVTSGSAQIQTSGSEIETQFEEINDRVTPKIEINLRAKPSVTDPGAVVVATIRNGEVVIRTGINRDVGWSRVIYNGQTLYCVNQYLTSAG